MPQVRYGDHSDGVEDKIRLLQSVLASGHRDVAMSLAESIKDTIRFERSQEVEAGRLDSSAEQSRVVGMLPGAWAEWARGWTHVKAVDLFETIGQARIHEPVTIHLGMLPDQCTDPARELRLARLDGEASTLHEVPCQVSGVVRDGRGWRCRLSFFAEAPMHGRATYLVFHGNPWAELPEYVTDLNVQGPGHGLRITNQYFTACLSEQSGQLERLIFRREHGLELYAGGKGHGEPPGIDWAHDYVDQEGFQKLRMRNWAECPNIEIELGPLFVRCRRWGFPHSPVHPLFTPSRIHLDETYTFFAGLPYFLKQGRIDAIQDVTVEAMRDDEWVFSGYSFDETLWLDRSGKLHTGPVPAEGGNDLWGVGFRNRTSRDAFLALWLEHRAVGHETVGNNGVPTLHYPGHGQLWSRYPVQHSRLHAGASIRQKNAYVVLDYPETGAAPVIEAFRHRLLNPLDVRAGDLPRSDRARGSGTLARTGETTETAPLKPAIWKALREVRDEQLYTADANIVDMGYVYDVRLRHGTAHIVVTMPHRGRPVHDYLVFQGGGRVTEGIRERLLKLNGIRAVVVDLTWNPLWSVVRLTDAGRRAMGLPVG